MKLQLTSHLLLFLEKSGYRYFLSKTVPDAYGPDIIGITLLPISIRPNTRNLPKDFDTYFCINQEPKQMAEGVEGTLIFVKMNADLSCAYIKYVIDEVIDNYKHTDQ